MSSSVESFSVVCASARAFANISNIEEARSKLAAAQARYPSKEWRIRKTTKIVEYVK